MKRCVKTILTTFSFCKDLKIIMVKPPFFYWLFIDFPSQTIFCGKVCNMVHRFKPPFLPKNVPRCFFCKYLSSFRNFFHSSFLKFCREIVGSEKNKTKTRFFPLTRPFMHPISFQNLKTTLISFVRPIITTLIMFLDQTSRADFLNHLIDRVRCHSFRER